MGFEKIAKYYHLLFDETNRLKNEENLLRDIINSSRPNPQVLDLACGTGVHSRFFASYGANVLGVDISPTMLYIAREYFTPFNIHYIVADIESLPFNNHWDIILCLGNTLSLIIDDEKIRKIFQSIYDIIKPNGNFLIQIVNYENPENSKASMKTTNKETEKFSATVIKTLIPEKDFVYLSISYFIKTDKELISDSDTNFLKKRKLDDLITIGKEVRFSISNVYGDFQKNPFLPEKSKDIIILFRKN